MMSDYSYYRAYLLMLKQRSPKLAMGMEKLWDMEDTPLDVRNDRLRFLLDIVNEINTARKEGKDE